MSRILIEMRIEEIDIETETLNQVYRETADQLDNLHYERSDLVDELQSSREEL